MSANSILYTSELVSAQVTVAFEDLFPSWGFWTVSISLQVSWKSCLVPLHRCPAFPCTALHLKPGSRQTAYQTQTPGELVGLSFPGNSKRTLVNRKLMCPMQTSCDICFPKVLRRPILRKFRDILDYWTISQSCLLGKPWRPPTPCAGLTCKVGERSGEETNGRGPQRCAGA